MASVNLRVKEKEQTIIDNNISIREKVNPHIDYHNCVCVKPWGYEFLAYESKYIGIWYLKINKGNATSLHAHFKKDTFIIVIEGAAKVSLVDDEVISLGKLQSVFIPKNKFHGLSSFSESVYLMEIEIYDRDVNFSDKNDLLRINDQYSRKSTGYESSVTVLRDNLDSFNHFHVQPNFSTSLFGSHIFTSNGSNIEQLAKSKYNILLNGIVHSNGFYLKEGTALTSDILSHMTCSKDTMILSIDNAFTNEDKKIIYCEEQLDVIVKELKLANQRIVLTSGCYDILHVGHLSHLQKAKQLGDVLIVCLSCDEQIKALKGDSRPINNYNDRINLFKTISYVDYIVLYNEECIPTEKTLGSLMKRIDPYCWTKGTDYTVDGILEKHPYLNKIVLFDNIQHKSTTNIINRILDASLKE